MSKQLKHDPVAVGGPCRRCGLVYSRKTAYVPCFEEGDTYGSWLARQSEELRKITAPTLFAMTELGFYDKVVKGMRDHGVPEADIHQYILSTIRESKALFEGKCPKCGAPLTRYVDPHRQQGGAQIPGIWVMYRCSSGLPPGQVQPPGACGFMTDLKEEL